MDSEHKGSFTDETRNSMKKSFKNSFKMINSVMEGALGKSKNSRILGIPTIRMVGQSEFKKQDTCQVCFVGFSKLKRQHHCRVCANAVCSECSNSLMNKQKCCDICAYKYENPDKQSNKKNIIAELESVAKLMIESKNAADQELKRLDKQNSDVDALERTIAAEERKMAQLQAKIDEAKEQRLRLQQEIAQIERNASKLIS